MRLPGADGEAQLRKEWDLWITQEQTQLYLFAVLRKSHSKSTAVYSSGMCTFPILTHGQPTCLTHRHGSRSSQAAGRTTRCPAKCRTASPHWLCSAPLETWRWSPPAAAPARRRSEAHTGTWLEASAGGEEESLGEILSSEELLAWWTEGYLVVSKANIPGEEHSQPITACGHLYAFSQLLQNWKMAGIKVVRHGDMELLLMGLNMDVCKRKTKNTHTLIKYQERYDFLTDRNSFPQYLSVPKSDFNASFNKLE